MCNEASNEPLESFVHITFFWGIYILCPFVVFSFEQLTFYHHIGVLTGALQVLIQFRSSGEMEEVWFQSTSNPYPHTLPWMRTVVVLNSREEFKVGVDVLNEGLCVFGRMGIIV